MEEFKKLTLLKSLGLSGSYNLVADSFNLSNISLNARTELFEKINLNFTGTLDPSTYVVTDRDEVTGEILQSRRTPNLAWRTGNGLGRITDARLGISTRFEGGKGGGNRREPDNNNQGGPGSFLQRDRDDDAPELQEFGANPQRYVDFSIPWAFRVSYTLGFTQRGLTEPTIRQTATFGGEVTFTQKWKVDFSSGYDFERQDFSFTQLSIFRDLHCWQLGITWIPFGVRQSYNVELGVKAPILQDLKLQKRNVWFDR